MSATRIRFSALLSLIAVVGLVGSANGGIVLPSPNPLLTNQFGDFTVYSLPFLENLFGQDFSVKSTPGEIKDGVVIMTGANGQDVTTNDVGIDNAYPTPNGNSGDPYFDTKDVADPSGGDPAGDSSITWDAEVVALRNFLAAQNGELVIYFNLNEENGDGLPGQDLLAWVQVDLIDTDGGLPTKTFFLSAADDPLTVPNERTAGLIASAAGAPDEQDPNENGINALDPRWATAHGPITVAADGSFLHFGTVEPGDPAGAKTINQNLGANEAAFAIFHQELNDLVKNPASGYDLLSAEIVMSRQSNGFEQAFILPMTNFGIIPEPGSLIVWSMLAVAVGMRRSRTAA